MSRKIFSLLLFPLALSAQSNVNIHCRFISAAADSCIMIPAQYFIDEYEKPYSAVIKSNECDFHFELLQPTVAQFIYNHQSVHVFLEPGDEMQWTINGDSLQNAISFSGKGAVHNTFLLSFYELFKNDFDKEEVTKTVLNSDGDAFEMNLYNERKKQLEFYNNYRDKNSFSQSFKKYVENTIRYNYFAQVLSYPIIQANQSSQILTVKAIPAVMLDGIDSKLVNDEALNCQTYRDFLYYYATYFTSEANGFNKFRDQSLSMESKVAIARKNFSGASLNWYIAWFLNNDVQKVSQYTAGHVYSVLGLTENNGTYTKLLKNKVDARLAQREEAPGGVKESDGNSASTNRVSAGESPKLKDVDGNYFTFGDLKGKVVYVDYWASWCGPCRSEMPFSKQLHGMFTDKQLKQIVFLYVSIDQSEDAWKDAIKQIGMEGKLGISPGNWQSPIARYFQINSIPRYMLIDKKGNIVDLNAKRPSSGQEIYNDILKLLQ